MPILPRASTLLALALLAAPAAGRAEGVGFKHEKTIYADDHEIALKTPEGLACDDNGAMVIADTGNGRLVTYGWKDGSLSGGAQVKLVEVTYPTRVQVDSKGNVFVLDRKAKRVGRVDLKGSFGGFIDLKGTSVAPSSIVPISFKVGPGDELYVLDVANRKVYVASQAGDVSRELALPAKGQFTDVAVDSAGTIFAIDGAASSVWTAPKGGTAFQSLTPSLKDRMSFPIYATISRGKLFLVDQNGNGVVVLGLDGSYQGRELALGATDGLVYYPGQLCVNAKGEAFLADRSNSRVQVFATAK